jgi:hypothetical protein
MQMGLPVTNSFAVNGRAQEPFDFDTMIKPYIDGDKYKKDANMALVAATALEQIDNVLGYLENQLVLKVIKPFHSTGEDFLHNFLGMAGIPIDLYSEFPSVKG